MDPAKVEAVQSFKAPQNVKQVQQFLGICNYYRRFIKDFAKVSQPIATLVCKDTPFIWSSDCELAFTTLKSLLLAYPILRQPDVSRPFTVYTDASGYALGAILAQHDANNQEYVCIYASRLLKNAEVHYGISEKECQAIVWAIRQFRIYLHGVHFTVVTAHNALVWLMSIHDPTGNLARWSIYLQQYEYDIVHRKGLKHSNVDTLSRPVLVIDVKSTSQSDTLPSFLSNVDPHEDEALLHYLQFGRHLAGQSKKKCKNVLQNATHYKYADNKLWYRNDVTFENFLEVPKRQRRYDLIQHEHLLGHYQTPTVYDALKLNYFWPRMRVDIHYFIKKCVKQIKFPRQVVRHTVHINIFVSFCSLGPLKKSLKMAQKVIVPQKKNYVPQFLKRRYINSYNILTPYIIMQQISLMGNNWPTAVG